MLFSLAIILLSGMIMGWICQKIKLPSLVGMLIVGIVIGPYVLNVIDSSILNISADIRKIALIIILTRAGLNLDVADLKKVGRPALLMCFLPACLEILGMVILAPIVMGVSYLEAAIMGCVVAAVSPAVIVPKMLKLMEEGYGKNHSIPQMILAGASVDDVFVIVLFTVFMSMAQGNSASIVSLLDIPVSIILGIVAGLVVGKGMGYFFKQIHIRDSAKVIIFISISFLLVTFENTAIIPFASLIAIMAIGVGLQHSLPIVSKRLSIKFNKLWVAAEILLFVLVGACVDISYVKQAGIASIILILSVLLFRVLGVYLCLLKTKLSNKERLFCMIAYCPKATVQAAIGAIPLTSGLAVGNIVLTVAVVSILITAPLGAFLIEQTYQKLLVK